MPATVLFLSLSFFARYLCESRRLHLIRQRLFSALVEILRAVGANAARQ